MENITPEQRDLLNKLQERFPGVSYDWDEARGFVSFVRTTESFTKENDAEEAIRAFLKEFGPLVGPANLDDTLRLLRSRKDDLGWTHLEYQQQLKTDTELLEVYNAKLIAHFTPDGRLIDVQSSCLKPEKPQNVLKVKPEQLQRDQLKRIRTVKGFEQLSQAMRRQKEVLFPLMQAPRLVIYPRKNELIQSWATYGYSNVTDQDKRSGKEFTELMFGQMFFDAEDGELFLFAPTRKGLETPNVGNGLGCLPLGGPFTSRSLNIVRVDSSSTYLLKNKTKARDIITYDANANASWVYPQIPALLENGTIPVSSDTDGDKNWSRTAPSTSDADRTASQQPEVDEHFICQQLYEWYDALAGGRAGWDDNQYAAPLVPHQTLRVVAHTFDNDPFTNTSRSINAFFDKQLVNGHWVSHLAFFDGDPTGTPPWRFDYLAGSPVIVGHEYQHAITDFNFMDGAGNPGLIYADWLAAVHEGLSDVFGGLFSGQWYMGTDISQTGQIFRNLAYPRDSSAADANKFDHFADRNMITGTGARYFRGDILAHAAYLTAQGGVHQRLSRTPALIPVYSLGREVHNGLEVYKAARIWYRAITFYLSSIGSMTGSPTNDENVFRTIRNGCVNAAIDIYGVGSVEHKTTVQAWYAVGLHPAGTSYGADMTFMRWGADWWMSRPFIGLSSPDWSSVDLFINNGGISEWNAQINVNTPAGPTQFENNVYCRVRNIGDQAATNVTVQFFYAKSGMGIPVWNPMLDKDGNVVSLSYATVAAGQSNFPDSAQNTPPVSAQVKWALPPLAPGETVDHFCIRAVVAADNDVNPNNNDVQSNVAYVPYVPGIGGFHLPFNAGNPFKEAIPLQVVIDSHLPKSWRTAIKGMNQKIRLKPGESRPLQVDLQIPDGSDKRMTAPFDGRIQGELKGKIQGKFTGQFSNVKSVRNRLSGLMSLSLERGFFVQGFFNGTIVPETGQLTGSITGQVHNPADTEKEPEKVQAEVNAFLRPDRVINISQFLNGKAIGGISVQVQVPLPDGSPFAKLPPTTVNVDALA